MKNNDTNFEYLYDPDEIEHGIEALRDMLSRERIEGLQETVTALIIEPLDRYIIESVDAANTKAEKAISRKKKRATGDHVEIQAATAFLLAAEAFIDLPGEGGLDRLAAEWRRWVLQHGYMNTIFANNHHRQRAAGGANSHGLDAKERARRNIEIQKAINRLCKNHSYNRACELAAKEYSLSIKTIKRNTENPK